MYRSSNELQETYSEKLGQDTIEPHASCPTPSSLRPERMVLPSSELERRCRLGTGLELGRPVHQSHPVDVVLPAAQLDGELHDTVGQVGKWQNYLLFTSNRIHELNTTSEGEDEGRMEGDDNRRRAQTGSWRTVEPSAPVAQKLPVLFSLNHKTPSTYSTAAMAEACAASRVWKSAEHQTKRKKIKLQQRKVTRNRRDKPAT